MSQIKDAALAIIGAGHAGRAAADLARELAIETVVLDQGHGNGSGNGALVWLIHGDGTICFSRDDTAHELTAQCIILAPGALDRPRLDEAPVAGGAEVPDIQITSALGLEHGWDPIQRFWYPMCGEAGGTSLERIFLAGAVTGRLGQAIAVWQGRRAVRAVAEKLGHDIGEGEQSEPPPAELQTPPSLDAARLNNEQIVCNCEGTTVGEIRRLAALGCDDVNQAKAFARPGAGECQGRRCAVAVAEVLAAARGVAVAEVGYFRQRWPTSPVSLDQLALFQELDDG